MGKPSDRDPSFMRDAHGTPNFWTTEKVRKRRSASSIYNFHVTCFLLFLERRLGRTGAKRFGWRRRADPPGDNSFCPEHAQRGMEQYHDALKHLADPSLIRNDEDYDDWEVGLEPIPGDPTWTKKLSS